jgi:hypothetical protein
VAGAGKDQLFWKEVLVELNDTSVANNQYGLLALTLESDLIIFKEKGTNAKTWSELQSMYQLILQDYKFKLENFKKSGMHESDFHNFAQGRLDTYYMHVWMLPWGPSTLEVLVGALPDAAKFDSDQVDLTSTASFSNLSGSDPRAKKECSKCNEQIH